MDGTLDHAVLDEVIRRVVEVASPEKIILLRSAVRGRMGPHSDFGSARGPVRSRHIGSHG